MLLWMVYIQGEVSVVGPEQMKNLLMNDPIYGIVWSLFISAIVTQRKKVPLFSVGRLKTKWFDLYDQDWSFMMQFLNCKAHLYRIIFCWHDPKSMTSHWNQSAIVEHTASCFYTLVNFWLWNHFWSWKIPRLCHVKFSSVLPHFQLAHEQNILVTHRLWIHGIFSALVLPCTCAFSQSPLKSC